MIEPPKPDAGDSKDRATLQDWCLLHSITPAQCIRWLENKPAPANITAPASATPLPAIDPAQVWQWSAQAMATALPAHRNRIFAARDGADINTSPDTRKFPNAFTLHDAGKGRPYVSVPYGGSARDILTLAHEFGHVLQLINTDATFTPPVLREVCAFMTEYWFLEYLGRINPLLHGYVMRPWARSVAVDFGTRQSALLTACTTPHTPYVYAWNYPLARRLALESIQKLDASDQWPLYEGGVDVPTLASRAGL